MVESVRVPKKYPDEYRKRVQSMCVTKNCTIRAITEKRWNPCEYRKSVRTSIGRVYNQRENRQMIAFGRVSGKGKIRASIEKVSGRVSEEGTISVSTAKWYNPVQYREKLESVRVPKKCPDEYRKRVQSRCVTKNCTI